MITGANLRRAREEAGLTLTDLAAHAGCSFSHLARVERGERPVTYQISRAYCRATGAEISGSGSFTPDDDDRLALAIAEPRRADREIVRYFERLFDTHTGTPELRPLDLVATLTPTHQLIDNFRRDAKAPIRHGLLVVSSRYAQLIGRMHYENGELAQAFAWSDRALLDAEQAGAEQLAAYTLARRASLAAASDDPAQAVDLATAARARTRLPSHVESMALRHEAQGHAMLGAADACRRCLDQSMELLAAPRSAEPSYAAGFSLGFLQVQAAGCYVELGRTSEAIEILERELPMIAPGRVRAFSLARLAHAYRVEGDSAHAADVGHKARAVARRAGAVRATMELHREGADRARWWD